VKRNPASTLERMKAYVMVRRLIEEGIEERPEFLMLRLEQEGLAVPSRHTVLRWARNTHSPTSSLQLFEPRPSEELSFFLGAWLGDGWADENDGGKRLLLKVRSYDFAKEFADCATKILSKTDPYRVRTVNKNGIWYLVKVTSLMLYQFVTQPLDAFREYIETCPRGFLKGIFTAEGNPTVSIAQHRHPHLTVDVTVSNSDRELMELTRKLLIAQDFRPGKISLHIREGTITNLAIARKTVWLIRLSWLRDVVLFADLIGFADSIKQTKIKDAISLITEKGRINAASEWKIFYNKVQGDWVKKNDFTYAW
jgi:intein-encoded DNA endonuclease-like protein